MDQHKHVKTKILAVIEVVPVIILVVAVIVLVPLPSAQSSSTTALRSSTASSASSSSASSAALPFASVGIAGGGGEGGSSYFTPTLVVVEVGGTVTWSNSDSIIHDVIFGNVTSPDIQPGSSWSHTFKTVGTYHYYCGYHAWMVGTIVVQA